MILWGVIIISVFPCAVFAISQSISVSATVGAVNAPSQIQIVSPATLDAPNTTKYIKTGTSFTIDFRVTDADTANVNYTITPSAGAVSVISGGPIAVPFNQQFTYLAPSTIPGGVKNQTITLAVNDGTSVAYKIINLYLY